MTLRNISLPVMAHTQTPLGRMATTVLLTLLQLLAPQIAIVDNTNSPDSSTQFSYNKSLLSTSVPSQHPLLRHTTASPRPATSPKTQQTGRLTNGLHLYAASSFFQMLAAAPHYSLPSSPRLAAGLLDTPTWIQISTDLTVQTLPSLPWIFWSTTSLLVVMHTLPTLSIPPPTVITDTIPPPLHLQKHSHHIPKSSKLFSHKYFHTTTITPIHKHLHHTPNLYK